MVFTFQKPGKSKKVFLDMGIPENEERRQLMPPIFRTRIELFLVGCSSAEPTSSSLNKTNFIQILSQKPTIFDHITFKKRQNSIERLQTPGYVTSHHFYNVQSGLM